MRNCDPGADDRPPIDRASQCWNDDLVLGCLGQPSGQCAPSRPLIDQYELLYSRPLDGGAVGEWGNHKKVKTAKHVEHFTVQGPAPHLKISRLSSSVHADSGSVDIERANHPRGLVCGSGPSASFFNLSFRLLSRSLPLKTSPAGEMSPRGFTFRTGLDVFSTSSQNGLRTHSWIRVSHEKRNVDECPPTRGKPNRHR